MMTTYLILSILIFVVFVKLIFFRHRSKKAQEQVPVPNIVEEKEKAIIESPPKKINTIKEGSYSKVKYMFYAPCVLETYLGRQLYKNIIMSNIWINEPFHTVFTSILKFLEEHDDCIKSDKTRTIKIKIAKTYEQADAYKVNSVRELTFITIGGVYERIKIKYNPQDIQIILIATLLFKIDILRSMSFVYSDIDNINCADIFLDKFDNSKKVLHVIKQIRQGAKQFDFVNHIFQDSKQFATEFPFEDSYKEQEKLLPLASYFPNIKKNLICCD